MFDSTWQREFIFAVVLAVILIVVGCFTGGFLIGQILYETDEADNQPSEGRIQPEAQGESARRANDLHPSGG